jgi:membrane-associated protease RseP (regulator of RpoE activity)
MNFLGIPLWEGRTNGFQKPVSNGWSSYPVPSEEPAPVVPRIRPPVRSRDAVQLHIILFLITLATTLVAGMWWAGIADPMTHLEQLYRGIPYAGTLLAILFCHEMGHYLTARYYGMDVSLPYFLPSPPSLMGIPFLGTFGAVIRMKSPPEHRRALLHVGAAGPIAGFCVALPAMLYAFATATQVRIDPTAGGPYFASPLLLHIIGYIVIGPIPSGMTLQVNSVGVAAWFGLLVTVFNLLPIGQLDGGHIVYALLGRQARYVSWAVIGALLVLGFLAWPGWILWAFLGWLSGRRQPVVLDQHAPLSRYSQVLAGIALIIFVLCFMPIPIQ